MNFSATALRYQLQPRIDMKKKRRTQGVTRQPLVDKKVFFNFLSAFWLQNTLSVQDKDEADEAHL